MADTLNRVVGAVVRTDPCGPWEILGNTAVDDLSEKAVLDRLHSPRHLSDQHEAVVVALWEVMSDGIVSSGTGSDPAIALTVARAVLPHRVVVRLPDGTTVPADPSVLHSHLIAAPYEGQSTL